MTKEKLEELGWKFDDFWNNRAMYSLNEKYEYVIFEHNDYGILNPYSKEFELIYCNLSDDEIVKFTELAKSVIAIYEDPKNHSFFDFCEAAKNVKNFVDEMKKRE